MSFSPTITHDSAAVPGLKFTVRRIGFGRRADIDSQTVKLRQRLRELELDYPPQSAREKELARQLEIATKKAEAVSAAIEAGEATAADFDRVLHEDVEPLAEQVADAAAPADRKRRKVLDEEYSAVQAQIHCFWIRSGLVSIEHKVGVGDCFDGMTADQLLDYGPPALGREIFDAIATGGRLAGKEAESLKSPGTSGAAVPTSTTNTTAPAAEPVDGTSSETVSATSR
jgi:hypothetical protein